MCLVILSDCADFIVPFGLFSLNRSLRKICLIVFFGRFIQELQNNFFVYFKDVFNGLTLSVVIVAKDSSVDLPDIINFTELD